MSTQTSPKYYFLNLIGNDPTDKTVKTNKDDVLNIRIKRVPTGSTIFLMDDPNDSLVCNLEIHGR